MLWAIGRAPNLRHYALGHIRRGGEGRRSDCPHDLLWRPIGGSMSKDGDRDERILRGKARTPTALGEASGAIERGKAKSGRGMSEIGRLGGIARKKKLTPAQRTEIARNASRARWKKPED